MNTFLIALFLITASICINYFYIKQYLRKLKVQKKTFPKTYKLILTEQFHPYKYLSENQKENLHFKILYFLEYKNFWPIGDFKIEENMKILIAAQACLLILNQKSEIPFSKLANIYISDSAFIEKENPINLNTMLPSHNVRLGESWLGGPLVLSWEDVQSGLTNWDGGQNVVYHEFTHQLDSMDHGMDGTPILKESSDYKTWQIIMGRNFLDLRKRIRNHKSISIDSYGATNEAEFFAVTVEEFFASPIDFYQDHRDIYELYKDYFELDPVNWR